MTSLTPRLTAFDQRVLDELGTTGKRAGKVADAVVRPGSASRRMATAADEARMVLEVLRGLEAVGLARHDNGYWRAA